MCGEHIELRGAWTVCGGSSPRVRGTCGDNPQQALIARFIPACAGNIARPVFDDRRNTVHPRVCGEHVRTMNTPSPMAGSSPRVRGTYLAQLKKLHKQRFIPACAGNIVRARFRYTAGSVHPRVCGEHQIMIRKYDPKIGSSPRVRGTSSLKRPIG